MAKSQNSRKSFLLYRIDYTIALHCCLRPLTLHQFIYMINIVKLFYDSIVWKVQLNFSFHYISLPLFFFLLYSTELEEQRFISYTNGMKCNHFHTFSPLTTMFSSHMPRVKKDIKWNLCHNLGEVPKRSILAHCWNNETLRYISTT